MADCFNFTGKIGRFEKTVTLHKLPSNPSLKRGWIIAVSRKNWRAINYTRVCSDHFKNGIGPNYLQLNSLLINPLTQLIKLQENHQKTEHPATLVSLVLKINI